MSDQGQVVARGLEYVRPTPEEREEINRIIMEELVCGACKGEAVAYHQQVIARIKDASCDGVILGCTETPLILNDANSPLPTYPLARTRGVALSRAG